MSIGKPPRTFVILDAMRGCAALAVVIQHTRLLFGWSAHISAYLAVDFFFGLSGFVLCHAYRERFSAGLTALEFLRIRLIRLYPLYLFSLVVALLVTAIDVQKGSISLARVASIAAREVFLLPSAANGLHQDAYFLNLAAWSLFFELLVNVAFVLIWPKLTVGRLRLICAASGLMMVPILLFNHSVSVGWSTITMPAGIVRVTFSFFLGVLIYEAGLPTIGNRIRLENDLAAAALIVALFAICMLSPSGPLRAAVDLGSIFVIFPAMIHVGARLRPSGWCIRASLLLGAASYAVYVIHVPVRDLFGNLLDLHPVRPSPVLGTVFLVGVTLLALLVDAIYDRPLRTWMSARFRRSDCSPLSDADMVVHARSVSGRLALDPRHSSRALSKPPDHGSDMPTPPHP